MTNEPFCEVNLIHQFGFEIKYLEGLAESTIRSYESDLYKINKRLAFQFKQNLLQAKAEELMEAIFSNLESHRTSLRAFSACNKFFNYLVCQGFISRSPLKEINNQQYAESPGKLPNFLTEKEVERLLSTPNQDNPYCVRDKAILELFYATGLRVTELVSLSLEQIDFDHNIIRVIGKGNKERIVCFNDIAKKALLHYIATARRELLKGELTNWLFIGRQYQYVEQFNYKTKEFKTIKKRKHISQRLADYIIKKYAHLAGLSKKKRQQISCHWLRHSFATHLVDNGANLVVVQQLLGHTQLSTTSIYLHTAVKWLLKIHRYFHPRP